MHCLWHIIRERSLEFNGENFRLKLETINWYQCAQSSNRTVSLINPTLTSSVFIYLFKFSLVCHSLCGKQRYYIISLAKGQE